MKLQELLVDQLETTRDWTRRLLADLSGDDWSFQPAPGLAHALFLCGHLAVSQDVLVHGRCLNRPILPDVFKAHFAIGRAVPSVREHDYPAVEDILRIMEDVHRRTCSAIAGMSDELLDQPAFGADGKTPHPHYRDKRGAISHCSRHEAFHAGQIALIRRLLGKTYLR
jgi:hypothetical protein